MRFQRDVADPLVLSDVDDRKGTIAVTDEQVLPSVVEPYIVGIVTQGDPPRFGVVAAAEEPHRSVAAVRDIQSLNSGNVSHTLRLLEAGDPVYDLLLLQINDGHSVIAELGHENTLAGQIDRHVIDTAAHFSQWNFRLNLQRCRLSERAARRHHDAGDEDGQEENFRDVLVHAQSPRRIECCADLDRLSSLTGGLLSPGPTNLGL